MKDFQTNVNVQYVAYISSALLAVFFRNPLCRVAVGRLPNPSGLLVLCVCRTNRGQPKVTRRFGTVLSTESVVAVLQGTQSELLLNLLQPSRTEGISVTTNWGDRHMACCSSQTQSKRILFITIRPLFRINRAYLRHFVILQFLPNKGGVEGFSNDGRHNYL